MAKVRIPFVVADQVYSFWMDDHDNRDFIVQLIVRHGLAAYEDPLPRLIAGIALQIGGNFLDIGANTGVYSLLYSCLELFVNSSLKIDNKSFFVSSHL